MCTRYYIDTNISIELIDYIEASNHHPLMDKFIRTPNGSLVKAGEVSPTDIAPVIAPNKNGQRAIYPMRWGFRNIQHDSLLFNARSETAGKKPTFREAWNAHRCIVPASYYFEWQHYIENGKEKTGDKYLIQPENSTVTWLCGLYHIENGLPTFVILTREPTEKLRVLHDRMPLILPTDKIDDWIHPNNRPEDFLQYAVTDLITEKVHEKAIKKQNQLSFL